MRPLEQILAAGYEVESALRPGLRVIVDVDYDDYIRLTWRINDGLNRVNPVEWQGVFHYIINVVQVSNERCIVALKPVTLCDL